MSYARYGRDSDVYVFQTMSGFECCGCSLFPDGNFDCLGRAEMIGHLISHRNSGDQVPEEALERLRNEE